MARLHILQRSGVNLYNVVVHAPTPAGSNSAGVSWATALANSGLTATTMTVGNGPGQISNSEANQVTSGALIEAPFLWEDNPAWTPQERTADLALRAQQAVDAVLADYAQRLKWFGLTVV